MDLGKMISLGMKCGVTKEPGPCTGECAWQSEPFLDPDPDPDPSPDPSPNSDPNHDARPALALALTQTTDPGPGRQGSCTGDCAWKPEENKCDVNMMTMLSTTRHLWAAVSPYHTNTMPL